MEDKKGDASTRRKRLAIDRSRLFEQALQLFPGGAQGILRSSFHMWGPLVISRARGAYMYDVEGREYLDYHMAFGAILLGHVIDEITEEVKRQAETLDLHGAGVSDIEIEYADMITRLIPSAEKLVFTNSGSEAVLVAMRLARAYTSRDVIIKFEGNYHGWHDYALYNVSTPLAKGKTPETDGIPRKVQDVIEVLPYNDVETLESYLAENSDNVAGIILEPVAHSMGVVRPTREFLDAVVRLAREYQIILVFDEIITAFRHNIRGLQYEYGITPDITTIGKAMANGYPVAAVAGRREIIDLITDRKVRTSGTYSGHPINMAAGKASLEKIVRERADRKAAEIGMEHAAILRDAVEDLGIDAYVANYRSIITVYFGLSEEPRNLQEALRADKKKYMFWNKLMRDRGILFSPNPLKRIHLSTSHGEKEMELFKEAVYSSLKQLKRDQANSLLVI